MIAGIGYVNDNDVIDDKLKFLVVYADMIVSKSIENGKVLQVKMDCKTNISWVRCYGWVDNEINPIAALREAQKIFKEYNEELEKEKAKLEEETQKVRTEGNKKYTYLDVDD